MMKKQLLLTCLLALGFTSFSYAGNDVPPIPQQKISTSAQRIASAAVDLLISKKVKQFSEYPLISDCEEYELNVYIETLNLLYFAGVDISVADSVASNVASDEFIYCESWN